MRKVEYKRIPNRLRKYRKERGLKQKDVADILGLKNTSMISRWEKGACLPNSLNIFKLAAIYQTFVDALFFDFIRMLKKSLLRRREEVAKG